MTSVDDRAFGGTRRRWLQRAAAAAVGPALWPLTGTAATPPSAVAPLTRLMTGMGSALRRPLARAPLPAPWSASDESMVLSAIAAQQRGDRACARTQLACHLPVAAVRLAMREIAELVVLLNRAGLQLDGRTMPRPDPALPHVLPTWCGDAGLHLRH